MPQVMDTIMIIAAIAKISRKKPEQIEPHLSLASLGINSSFGLSALRALLEAQSHSRMAPLRAPMKVADIFAMLNGDAHASLNLLPPAPSSCPQVTGGEPQHAASLSGLALGMDMQEISSLPLASDYRTDEFYISHFTPQEIATALLRPDSRAHLCGIFCAKEAAKKSRPELLELRMTDFVVTHDDAGRPILNIVRDYPWTGKFKFLLSITHTAQVAAATCITVGTE